MYSNMHNDSGSLRATFVKERLERNSIRLGSTATEILDEKLMHD